MNYSKQAGIIKCEFCMFTVRLPQRPHARLVNKVCDVMVEKADAKEKRRCGFQEVEYRLKFRLFNSERKFQLFVCICPSCFLNQEGYFAQAYTCIGDCMRCKGGKIFLCKGKSNTDWFYLCSNNQCQFKARVLSLATNVTINHKVACQKCNLSMLNIKFNAQAEDLKDKTFTGACPLCDEALKEKVIDFSNAEDISGKNSFKHKGRKGKKPFKPQP